MCFDYILRESGNPSSAGKHLTALRHCKCSRCRHHMWRRKALEQIVVQKPGVQHLWVGRVQSLSKASVLELGMGEHTGRWQKALVFIIGDNMRCGRRAQREEQGRESEPRLA